MCEHSPHAKDCRRRPCKSCGKEMIWAVTEAREGKPGRHIPLNADPAEGGNIVFSGPGQVRYLKRGDVTPYPTARYTSHFSSCEFADQFRKDKKR